MDALAATATGVAAVVVWVALIPVNMRNADLIGGPDSRLRRKQRARIAALTAARDVLTSPQGFAVRSVPDAIDLVSLARYIIDGGDPWQPEVETVRIKTFPLA